MSFRRNVLANYASQLYVTGIGLLMVPQYLRHLGPEAYGLVGIFTMMQAWFQLLDMGLSPTFTREVARFRGGAVSAEQLRLLLLALESFFIVTATVAAVGVVCLSETIAVSWLRPETLSAGQVEEAVVLMGLCVPLRWISGLYRGAFNGFEKQSLLGTINVFVATLRFVGVVVALQYIAPTPKVFFGYQIGIAAIEVVVLGCSVHALMPVGTKGRGAAWKDIAEKLRFSIGISLTGGVWIVITQADKLLLSKVLTLKDYGYISLAVAVAGGVNIVTGPVSQALMPRMVRLRAENDHEGVLLIYRKSTRVVGAIVGSVGGVLAFLAEPILFAWTGDRNASTHSHLPLTWYALGNGALALAAFPYYLQYASGSLRLHLIGNAIMAAIMLPLVWLLTNEYGGAGGGMAWSVSIIAYLVIWVSYSHSRLMPGFSWTWLWSDVGMLVLPLLLLPGLVGSVVNMEGLSRLAAATVPIGTLLASGMLGVFMYRRPAPVSQK